MTGMKTTAMTQAMAEDGLRLAETKIAATTAIAMCPTRTSAAARSKSLISVPPGVSNRPSMRRR
jgi:hypothetical protein